MSSLLGTSEELALDKRGKGAEELLLDKLDVFLSRRFNWFEEGGLTAEGNWSDFGAGKKSPENKFTSNQYDQASLFDPTKTSSQLTYPNSPNLPYFDKLYDCVNI